MRMGNSHPSLFPYDALPAADQELIITAGNDGQFRTLCQVLGVPELVDDPRFRGNQDRTANRDELRALLIERLADADGGRVVHATSSPRACRAARSTPWTAGWPSPSGWASIPSSGSARTPSRPSATRSRSRPRPPGTRCRRPGSTSTATPIRAWLAEPAEPAESAETAGASESARGPA